MGLSEHEQQLLDDMERRLYQSEADVMHAPEASTRRMNLRSLVLGILGVLIGVGVLIGGVASQQLWLGLIGFAVMLGGTVLAFTGSETVTPGDASAQSSSTKSTNRESFSERMNRRWDERMDGDR